MKKLFPLFVLAAGAVAYSVYKNKKDTEHSDEDKTFVVIDETPVNDTGDASLSNEVANTEKSELLNDESVAAPVEERTPDVQEAEEDTVSSALNEEDDQCDLPDFFQVEEETQEPSEIVTVLIEEEPEEELSSAAEEEMNEQTNELFVESEDFDQLMEIISENEAELNETEDSEAQECEETNETAEKLTEVEAAEENTVGSTAEQIVEEEESVMEESAVVEESVEDLPALDDLPEFDEEFFGVSALGFGDLDELTSDDNEAVETLSEELFVEAEESSEPLAETIAESDEEETALSAIEEEESDDQISLEPEISVEDEVDSLIEEIAGQIEESANLIEKEPEELKDVELESLQPYNTPEVDELMKEIAGQVKAADELKDEPELEEETVEDSDEQLEPELEEQPAEEPEDEPEENTDYLQDIRKMTELYSEKAAQYNIRYPYLSSRFVDDTLKFADQFNAEYPLGTRVAIEHHAYFNDLDDLFVFAQIIHQSGYAVREGEGKNTLIMLKEMYVDTNSILHDVFKVANQVYCLSGEYHKFRISKR